MFSVSLLTVFSSKGQDMNWIPQLCSVNGLQVVFVGADLNQVPDLSIRLNGLFHISTKDWMENVEYSVTAPVVSGAFPSSLDFFWYSKTERLGYRIKEGVLENISDNQFNKSFHKDNLIKIQFCMGLKGTLYVFISNGVERFLIQKIKAEQVQPNELNSNIDFSKMSDLLERRLKVSLNDVTLSKQDFENSIPEVKNIRIRSKGLDKLFLMLHFIDKQIKIIDPDILLEDENFPFPVAIDVYDKQKNLIKRIDFNEEFNVYSRIENQVLTVLSDFKNFEARILLSSGKDVSFAK